MSKVTPAGLDALERAVAEHPNVFTSVARETLGELIKMGRTTRFRVEGDTFVMEDVTDEVLTEREGTT